MSFDKEAYWTRRNEGRRVTCFLGKVAFEEGGKSGQVPYDPIVSITPIQGSHMIRVAGKMQIVNRSAARNFEKKLHPGSKTTFKHFEGEPRFKWINKGSNRDRVMRQRSVAR